MSDAVATAGAVAIALGLVEVLKMVIPMITGKKGDESPKNIAADPTLNRVEASVNDLVSWHAMRDPNGVPLGYFPRSVEIKLDESVKLLRETAASIERTATIQERLEKNLERIDDKVSDLTQEVRQVARIR